MEEWRCAVGFAAVKREVIERDPQPPRIKMKRRQCGLAGGQFLNLFDNGPANVIIRGTIRENKHQAEWHRDKRQDNAQDPTFPFPPCSTFGHGWLPSLMVDASIGSSSIFMRGLVSSNEAAVRSLTPCSMSNSRI